MVLLGAVEAQEAVIYRGFAELRQPQNLPQNEWVWEPGEALFQSLVPGTLRLIGVTELSRRVQVAAQPNPLLAYVGKEVQFFWEGQWRRATLVSAERNLYLYEGRYLVGLPGVVAYPDPSGFSAVPGPRVTFRYQGAGAAALAYLTRALTWSLRYTLEDGELTGWATLTNGLGRPLQLGRTELVAGSVPLLDVPAPRPEARMLQADATEAEFVGEAAGTYRYRLPGAVTLEPGQTELPFIRARVEPVYLWRLQTGFSTERELAFVRGFRFVAPENLAAGVVSIRAQGVFVGQAGMGDTAKGDNVTLVLGPDPEGRATRQVEQQARNRFRVTTSLRNPKPYPVEVEIQETMPQPFTLEGEGLERTPEGYRLRFTLAPGQSRSYAYTLTLPQR
ncbi:hypothetical protein Mtai_v1c17750 [Meiothermus taiwanensis WR-220]|uniref:DUF4139 domain-containing protein n=3 Tax=Meiothermus taiwanensis TaxID=172827 RepID=A0A399DZD4_9DEIN|nr:hypothetical protein Mtai_v1c17750 [Meiothermus taiwanensis WR-220]RIH77617.1 hypothetical protein Mcate_01238 [Meiothermus taiwanensis]